MNSPLHVVLVGITAEPHSGWGSMMHEHALALHEAGVPFTLLLPRRAPRVSAPYAACVHHVIPPIPIAFRAWRDWLMIPSLWRFPSIPFPDQAVVHALVDTPHAAWAERYAPATSRTSRGTTAEDSKEAREETRSCDMVDSGVRAGLPETGTSTAQRSRHRFEDGREDASVQGTRRP